MKLASGCTYLVTGVTGQDGFYSARRFLRKGARVIAVSKVQGMEQVEDFRTGRNIFAVSAICFNHDSFLSPESHLVSLVPRKLLRFKADMGSVLKFYNTDMRRDWSHAKDFARAFDLM